MKKIICIVLAAILLMTCLSLVSCGGNISLIKNGTAQFKVVYASADSKNARSAANSLVKDLKALGVSVDNPVTDNDITEVSDCEIIFGASVKNRSDDCYVDLESLGEYGYVIKAVGSKIVIAAGCADAYASAIAKFKSAYLGVGEDTTTLNNASVSSSLFDEFVALHDITSFTIGGVSIDEFAFAYDYGTNSAIAKECPNLDKFIKQINVAIGLEIPTSVKLSALDSSAEHKFIVRYVSDAGTKGFRAYEDDGDFIVECSYWNAFDKTLSKFLNEYLFDKKGEVKLESDFLYEHDVTVVRYSEFGAKGDGVTNDIEAIVATHDYANKCGQKVLSDGRVTYYISNTNRGTTKKPSIISATIKTDTDFGNATFYIDDYWGTDVNGKNEAYACKNSHIFYIMSDYEPIVLDADKITELGGGTMPSVPAYSTSIPWLKDVLPADAMLLLRNDDKKDYIRFGGNSNDGSGRAEVILVDSEGNVDPTTPITFDFDKFTSITIYRTDDKPITVEGGKFITESNRVCIDTNYQNKCNYWRRGIGFQRSNATITGIDHKMVDEPQQAATKEEDNFSQAYPYNWINIEYLYNSTLKDSVLTGHRVYREDERGRSGSITDMGTYDFSVQYTVGVTIKGVTQQSSTPIHDGSFWGITGSNWTRNITFDSCKLSRFDAHCGFWNADIIDCELGTIINVIGGGQLNIIRTKRYTGDAFITLRGDYGATFQGDILIQDCEFMAVQAYKSQEGNAYDEALRVSTGYVIKANQIPSNGIYQPGTQFERNYFTHDFGYDCYMPENIVLDNFVSGARKTYMFSNLYNGLFDKQNSTDRVYALTKSVVYRNMSAVFPIVSNTTTYSRVASIPQILEK